MVQHGAWDDNSRSDCGGQTLALIIPARFTEKTGWLCWTQLKLCLLKPLKTDPVKRFDLDPNFPRSKHKSLFHRGGRLFRREAVVHHILGSRSRCLAPWSRPAFVLSQRLLL